MKLVDNADSESASDLPFAEGSEVIVLDELSHQHTGLVTYVEPGADPRYNVLLTCRGQFRELLVRERDIVAEALCEAA
jgi:hypothetical protein